MKQFIRLTTKSGYTECGEYITIGDGLVFVLQKDEQGGIIYNGASPACGVEDIAIVDTFTQKPI